MAVINWAVYWEISVRSCQPSHRRDATVVVVWRQKLPFMMLLLVISDAPLKPLLIIMHEEKFQHDIIKIHTGL